MGKHGGKEGIVRMLVAITLVAGFFAYFIPPAQADAPDMLSFQGRLTDSIGNLLGGSGTTYHFRFRIYDDETAGTVQWASGASGVPVTVTQGVFNVLLGDSTLLNMAVLPPDLFTGDPRWLEVDVSDSGPGGPFDTMSPRQRIVASGYALVSENVFGGDVEDIDEFTQTGLGDCDGAGDKVIYDVTTGKFDCAVDSTGSGGSTMEIEEFDSIFNSNQISSLSFDGGKFTLTASGANDVGINLDWGAGGPASLSQDETVTGHWTFANGASFSGPVEFSNGASFSSITIGGASFTTLRPASNSLDFDEFENAMNLDANTTITGGAFALTFDHASVSGALEIGSLVGAGLTDCDGTTQKLLWNVSTGLFSCGSDHNGLEVREGAVGAGAFTRISSMSFNAPHFTLTFPTASESFVSLDWGAGGPASLSQNETVTGHWNFVNGASFSGPVEFSNGASFSSLTIGGATFTTLRPASNSLDWDEFSNAMTVDAATTINAAAGLTFSNASVSGALEIGSLFGAGLTDCDADGQTLSWDATTGLFGCGDDDTASGGAALGMREGFTGPFTNKSSISFNAPHFNLDLSNADARLSLDWGAGGPASLSQDETVTGHWNFANGASFSGPVEFSNGASFSSITLGGTTVTSLGVKTEESGVQVLAASRILNYDGGKFTLTASGTTETIFNLDWGAGGPASLSQNETVTGHWTFANGASFSGPVEFSNGASFSSITLGGATFTTLRPASNSLDWDEFSNAMTVDAATTINAAAGLTFSNASVSGALEIGSLFGAGLTDCDGDAQTLSWDATTGLFGCGDDDTASGGAAVGMREGFIGAFSNRSSISFNAAHFNLDLANPDARLSLDWGAGGPASLSQDETVTGHWNFVNGASFSGPVEFSNGASFSSITLGGATFTTLRPASNSLDWDEFSNAMTVDAPTTINAAAGLTFSNASVSGALEIGSLFGAGLTDCDAATTSKLLWDATTGLFSCGTDQTGSFAGIGLREDSSPTFLHITSISFAAPHFNITNTASQAFVRLDWGAGGPASLSQNETVTGHWNFTNGASFSGPVEFSNGASFSSLTLNGQTFTSLRPASNSLDFDEFENAMDLDANTTITGGLFALTFDHASVSGAFEVAGAINANGTILNQVGSVQIADSASVSGALEVLGTLIASGSFRGAGLTDCVGAGTKLQWSSATGLFSCGVDQTTGGGGTGTIEVRDLPGVFDSFPATMSFDGGKFTLTASGGSDVSINLDWGAGGPASLSQNETVTGNWTFANQVTINTSSVSNALEVAGTGASVSQLFIGGVLINPNNFRPASNSIDWDEIVNAMTLDASTTTTLGANTLTFGGLRLAGTSASISGNLEVTGYSSSSQVFGAGLTDCDTAATSKLLWDATTGRFSCGTDQTSSGGAALGMREGFTGPFTNKSSISFNAPHFNLDLSNADARLSLDWGAGGPASLSQDETVTGHWNFANGASFSGPVEFSNGASFSSITLGGVAFTSFRPASNSIDWDEIVNAMTLDASTTTALGANTLTFGGLRLAGTSASISGNLEVTGYSSSSAIFGAGLTDCDTAATSKLLWDATTGRFSCGTDQAGSGSDPIGVREGFAAAFTSAASLSFNGAHFDVAFVGSDARVSLDWGAGGPASLSQNETVTGNWNFTGQTTFTGGASFSAPVEFSGGASMSALTVGGVSVDNRISSLRPANNANTIANADFAQTWNWALTTASKSALTIGESAAATGVGNRLFRINALATSTATPLFINNLGSASSLLIHDSASDSSPFVVSAAGHVGIGAIPTVGQVLNITKTFDNASNGGTQVPLTINASTSITAGFSQITGISNTVRNSGTTGTTGVTRGAFFTIQANGSQVYTTNNFVNTLLSVQTLPGQSGAIADAQGLRINTPSFTGAVPTSNWGINLLNQGFAGVASSSALRIPAQSGSTENYAIISDLGNLHGFGTLDPARTVDIVGTFRLTGTGSVSSNFEIGGFVSASQTFGSGLTDCDTAATSKLLWDATTGRFSCGTVQTGSTFSGLEVREGAVGAGAFTRVGSMSFNAPHFTVSFPTASESFISLDWGAGGPASLSQNETVTGTWTFSNTPVGNFRPASNSIDWDEIVNAMTLDASTTTTLGANTLTFGGLRLAGTSASISGNLEVTGYASVSALFGAGLTDCDADNQTLAWNISTGLFGCGDDDSGAANTLNLSFLPEYPGATMSSLSASCTTCTGRMTSDNDIASPYRNFYKWTTTQAASQSYDIWVKVDVPNDFSSLSSISVEGFRSSTNDRVYFAIFDSANTQSASTAGKGTSVATSNATWTTATIAAPSGTYTAGTSITFRIRMEAGQNQNVRAGRIRLEYVSSF